MAINDVKAILTKTFGFCVAFVSLQAANLVENPGFEEGLEGWNVEKDGGMSRVVPEAAYKSQQGLLVVDESDSSGSYADTVKFPAQAGENFRLLFRSRLISGDGIAVYVRFLNQAGKAASAATKDSDLLTINSSKDWMLYRQEFIAPENTESVYLSIHSFGKAKVTACFDDFSFESIGQLAPGQSLSGPRWTPLYKIHPEEKEKLTEADVVGPDGLVYPNWTHVGVRGGIPVKSVTHTLTVKDQDEIGVPLRKLLATLGPKGGVIQLPAGHFFLDAPVRFFQNNTVLRGAGIDKTKIHFRYQVPRGKLNFPHLKNGDEVGLGSFAEVHAHPEGLVTLSIDLDGKSLVKTSYNEQWGLTYSIRVGISNAVKSHAGGTLTLIGRAEYENGDRFEEKLILRATEAPIGLRASQFPAALEFIPSSPDFAKRRSLLKQDGKRGGRTLALSPKHGFVVGDRLRIEAPASDQWNALVKNACPYGTYRQNLYDVIAVRGDEVEIPEPLRLEFPVGDGSYVEAISTIEHCGVEDLTLEQTERHWASGIVFNSSWNCWLKGVRVVKPGRHPFYFPLGKYGEVRDCEFNDAWWKGGGGTAYVGFERSYDCLLDNVKTSRLRHAPNLNWAASGCVFRNSFFDGTDGQWHCGWANENLFENCTILSGTNGGGYGNGLFSTRPEDSTHGPIGPRNVVFHCDVRSPKDGLQLNGMNEAWIIAYNRFTIEEGHGIAARLHSFDHLIRSNVFNIKRLTPPAIELLSADCSGWEIVGNRFIGVPPEEMLGGAGKALLLKDNEISTASELPLPSPSYPSIFDWQKNRAAGK